MRNSRKQNDARKTLRRGLCDVTNRNPISDLSNSQSKSAKGIFIKRRASSVSSAFGRNGSREESHIPEQNWALESGCKCLSSSYKVRNGRDLRRCELTSNIAQSLLDCPNIIEESARLGTRASISLVAHSLCGASCAVAYGSLPSKSY
jgi:hypothetical protein